MFKNTSIVTALLIALGFATPGAVFGQESEEDDKMLALEEVIVTARKMAESLQEIPLSVTAFNAELIREQQIVNIEDLVNFTPGVIINNEFGSRRNSAIRVRGVEPTNNTERNKGTASSFLDGIYLPGSSQWVGMNDIEQVEFVKGPQSAFFGRATFSGAVNYISKTPETNEWGVDVQTIFGSDGRLDVWAAADGALIKDKLYIRASGRYYTYDGAWDNNPPANPNVDRPNAEYADTIGSQQSDTGSLTIFATPTDNLAIKFRYLKNKDDDGPGTQFIIAGENNNCGPFNGGRSDYYCGTLNSSLITNGVSIDTAPNDDKRYRDEPGYDVENTFWALNMDWDIGGSGYTLTSLSGGYKEETSEYKAQIPNELDVFVEWKDESFSQELRLASPTDQRFRWMVGAYYLDLSYYKEGRVGFPSPGPQGVFSLGQGRGAPGLFGVDPAVENSIENKAIFGSVNYDITDKMTLSVELRREEETLELVGSSFIQEAKPLDSSTDALAIATARPFGGATIPAKGKFKATLPRVILDYQWTENTMTYASYSEGNNPGGFNPEVMQLEPTTALPAFQAVVEGVGYTTEQAELNAYELGIKHSLANGRGYINGAFYTMDWKNQLFGGFLRNADSNGDGRFVAGSDRLGQQIDYNANGSTDIYGFELDGAYALHEYWTVSAGYNYTKTDIQEYNDTQNLRVLGDASAAGKEVAQSPRHQANLSLAFNKPAGTIFGQQDGEWFARWDTWYQSSTYTWTINLAKTEAAALHNLRAGWQNDRYSVAFWIRNVLDDDPVLASRRTTGSFLTGKLGYFVSLPEPRTFGVTLTARFGR